MQIKWSCKLDDDYVIDKYIHFDQPLYEIAMTVHTTCNPYSFETLNQNTNKNLTSSFGHIRVDQFYF